MLVLIYPTVKDVFPFWFYIFIVSGIRLAATRKLVPSGLLLGLSIFALTVFISAYLQDISDPLRVS